MVLCAPTYKDLQKMLSEKGKLQKSMYNTNPFKGKKFFKNPQVFIIYFIENNPGKHTPPTWGLLCEKWEGLGLGL